MYTLNLSGFATGDSLSIAVTQDGQTAGPLTVPAWARNDSGGTIAINVDRTELKCAPDSVRFSVDLSAAVFDTSGPATGEHYDARMHDLIYLWDFGDTGDWSAPVNVLAEWKKRSVAKGPWVSHMYRQPGSYDASVLVIEPSTGKNATASVSIVVADPDVAYAASNTICVNPVGDGDFAGAPPGARKIGVDALLTTSPEWLNEQGGNAKRWLFKRGASFDVNLFLTSMDTQGITFGSYGTAGQKPILNAIGQPSSDKSPFFWNGGYPSHPQNLPPDIRFFGLNIRGNFDPTTMRSDRDSTGMAGTAIAAFGNVHMIVSECDFSGFMATTIYFDPVDQTFANRMHLDDCTLSDFGGQYPIYCATTTAPDSAISLTGCRVAQNPNAVDTDANTHGSSRATIRIDHAQHTHVRGCDFFHTDRAQHCIKTPETPWSEGVIVNIHSTAFEGGFGAVVLGGNTTTPTPGNGLRRSSVQNVILDGLIYVGNHSSNQPFRSFVTGVTIRNSIVSIPAIPTYMWSADSFIVLQSHGTFDPTVVGAAPIRIYNNTFRMDRTSGQNNSHVPPLVNDTYANGLFTNVTTDNNVIHMPNLDTPLTAAAPVSDTVLWTPRGLGRRDPDTLVLDSAYALPADAVKATRPLPGSAALGAALSGEVSYMDIRLKDRPEPPSQGAWEAD